MSHTHGAAEYVGTIFFIFWNILKWHDCAYLLAYLSK